APARPLGGAARLSRPVAHPAPARARDPARRGRPRQPRRGRPSLSARPRGGRGRGLGPRARDPRGPAAAPGAQSGRPLPPALVLFDSGRAKKWLFQAVFATMDPSGRCRSRTGSFGGNGERGGWALYKIGEKVVYPHHGAGTIVKKESRDVLGQKREYLTIKILHNDMTVQVPSENAEKVGLRRVIGEKEVGVVLKALTGGSTEMPKNWNRRCRRTRDKM